MVQGEQLSKYGIIIPSSNQYTCKKTDYSLIKVETKTTIKGMMIMIRSMMVVLT